MEPPTFDSPSSDAFDLRKITCPRKARRMAGILSDFDEEMSLSDVDMLKNKHHSRLLKELFKNEVVITDFVRSADKCSQAFQTGNIKFEIEPIRRVHASLTNLLGEVKAAWLKEMSRVKMWKTVRRMLNYCLLVLLVAVFTCFIYWGISKNRVLGFVGFTGCMAALIAVDAFLIWKFRKFFKFVSSIQSVLDSMLIGLEILTQTLGAFEMCVTRLNNGGDVDDNLSAYEDLSESLKTTVAKMKQLIIKKLEEVNEAEIPHWLC